MIFYRFFGMYALRRKQNHRKATSPKAHGNAS
jgi:hypothetical protein